MELEYVNIWFCGFVLEKSGSAFYSGGKKKFSCPYSGLEGIYVEQNYCSTHS